MPLRASSSVARFSNPNSPNLTYIVCGTTNGRSGSSPGTGPMLQVSVPMVGNTALVQPPDQREPWAGFARQKLSILLVPQTVPPSVEQNDASRGDSDALLGECALDIGNIDDGAFTEPLDPLVAGDIDEHAPSHDGRHRLHSKTI